MMASKYFFFLLPIPVVAVLWLRPVTAWRVPLRRWFQLIGIAALVWVCLDWTPFLPSTWEYARTYLTGQQTVHGSLYVMGRIYPNLLECGLHGTPVWFYAVFAAVKLAPLTVLCAAIGLGVAIAQRKASHRIVLSWMAVWFLVHSVSGSKWGRFFTPVLPAFLLLAAHSIILGAATLRTRRPALSYAAMAALGIALCFLDDGPDPRPRRGEGLQARPGRIALSRSQGRGAGVRKARGAVKEAGMAAQLQMEDLVVGTGAEAKKGQTVSVHYTGWLAD